MNEDFRAFWAVVPATVLYDDSIPANAKLLYGQISTMTGYTGEGGCCTATNAQLAGPNKLSEDSVSRLIKALEKAGHIEVRYAPDPKDGHPVRCCKHPPLPAKMPISLSAKKPTPYRQKNR